MEKAFYLHERELAILMSAMGYKELYGYPLTVVEKIDQQMVNMTLFQMAKKNILEISEQGIYIKEEYRDIVKLIASAKQLYVCADSNNEHPQMFFYMSSKIVMLCGQGQDSYIIRIEVWKEEQLSEKLSEYGILVESWLQGSKSDAPEQSDEEFFKKNVKNWYSISLEELLKVENLFFAFRKYDTVLRQLQFQVVVVRHGIKDYLVGYDSENVIVEAYSEKRLQRMLVKHRKD